MVLDENGAPGGRIWQALETRGAKDADEAAALALIRRFRGSPVEAHWNATVWAIEPDGQVFWADADGAHSVSARNVLLATGTTERPLPIPGWTLPGVMTVGAAQIALKTGGLVPDGRTWLAGQGPLLLLYATQVLDAGGRIAGVIDLFGRISRRCGRFEHVSLAALPEIRRGLAWRRRLSQAGVRWIAASAVRAEGEAAVQAVSFRCREGWKTEDADLLLLHDGVIPSVQMSRAIGCAHTWNDTQRCWQPVVDEWGRTSVPGVLIAGDGAGVGWRGGSRAVGADRGVGVGRRRCLGIAGGTGAMPGGAAVAGRAVRARADAAG